jgi:hypothetical protein
MFGGGIGDGMMDARNLMLTMLGGGTLAGLLLGASVETTMKPPPDPPWRHTARFDPTASSYQYVDSGPQDLSPYWPVGGDRTPTWARRRMIDETPYYVPPPTSDEEDARLLAIEAEAADQPAADVPDRPEAPAPAPAISPPVVTAAQDAADDARAAMAPAAASAITPATTTAAAPQPAEDDAAAL